MAGITIQVEQKRFSDLDLNFQAHPIIGDINKHYDEMAIVNSVKNLILTNHYERLFNPDIGSNTRKLLFEPMDVITSTALQRDIEQTLANFEPRITVGSVSVVANFDQGAYDVTLSFTIVNRMEPITINFILERVR